MIARCIYRVGSWHKECLCREGRDEGLWACVLVHRASRGKEKRARGMRMLWSRRLIYEACACYLLYRLSVCQLLLVLGVCAFSRLRNFMYVRQCQTCAKRVKFSRVVTESLRPHSPYVSSLPPLSAAVRASDISKNHKKRKFERDRSIPKVCYICVLTCSIACCHLFLSALLPSPAPLPSPPFSLLALFPPLFFFDISSSPLLPSFLPFRLPFSPLFSYILQIYSIPSPPSLVSSSLLSSFPGPLLHFHLLFSAPLSFPLFSSPLFLSHFLIPSPLFCSSLLSSLLFTPLLCSPLFSLVLPLLPFSRVLVFSPLLSPLLLSLHLLFSSLLSTPLLFSPL